jgi:diguanylate cyclase (GGDEF)-like protein
MRYKELIQSIEHLGKDPSRLIFEDELTGIQNRRFLLHYFQSVPWDALADRSLSLIMMDVDRFKRINDNHGHQAGDQALIWIAKVLKEVAGGAGIPIRYAGDEFMIFLPSAGKESALAMGEQVLQRVREEPLRLDEPDIPLNITLSIGIASVPEDAHHEKGLIHKADIALYYAKKAGRGRVANAAEVVPEEVLTKTALYQLDETKIVGRKQQLAQVTAGLRKFSQRKSQFLIVEGAAGMGKSEFLEAIHRSMSRSKIRQLRVRGVQQELFRPYYLITNILLAILSQRRDKGDGAFKGFSSEQIAHLAHILPQLKDAAKVAPGEDEKAQREAIFATLVRFFARAVNNRPVVLLIDDLHFADEATLILLRKLMVDGKIPLFICGTSMDTNHPKVEEGSAPLERLYDT